MILSVITPGENDGWTTNRAAKVLQTLNKLEAHGSQFNIYRITRAMILPT